MSRQILKVLSERLPPKHTVILGYHRVREDKLQGCDTLSALRMHVDLLLSLKYEFATLSGLAERAFRPRNRTAVLTFDDGYQDFYYIVAPLLREYGIRATVFVVTGYIDTERIFSWIGLSEPPLDYVMNSSQLRELSREGFEFGAHTVNHLELTSVSLRDAEQEIVQSKRFLEQLLQKPITSFCYPRGCYNSDIMQVVRKSGFSAAVVSRFSACVKHPWTPRNSPWDLARIYPYDDPRGFRRQISTGYELLQYASYVVRMWRRR